MFRDATRTTNPLIAIVSSALVVMAVVLIGILIVHNVLAVLM
jgi:hypothetical protein